MNRFLLPFLLLLSHGSPDRVVVAEPIIATYPVSYRPAEVLRTHAVRYEATRWGVPERIALAVSSAEVHNADSTARNPLTGALGVMQIHPNNFGDYDDLCYGPGDMTNIRRNTCTGMLLLRGYYDITGSWSAALRLYLGYRNNTAALLSYLDDIVDYMAGI